ncbi:MAG: chemotaxis protein CheA, partial [Oligoflexales bacterium]|nr:chemotaxis protein CheA [Oligoflexales bacterium]
FYKENEHFLNDILGHILRNSLDHSIEDENERSHNNKNIFGTINIRMRHEKPSLVLEIDDDGRGLFMEGIREKAVRDGLIDAGESNPNRIASSIFVPGFSTRRNASEISGRGIGMDAVSEFIRQKGGTMEIVLRNDRGNDRYVPFSLKISLPESMVFVET